MEQAGSSVNGAQVGESRKHEGEPKLPLSVLLYALFLLLRGGLLLFLSTVTLSSHLGDPHSGSKSKRIFLSADLPYQVIQPVRELP